MAGMEEADHKTDQGNAGSPPLSQGEPSPTAPTPLPGVASENSPFLGKLVTQKTTIPLNAESSGEDSELQKRISAITASVTSVTKETTASTQVGKTPFDTQKSGGLASEDLIHSGNIISLLQEEAQKELGIDTVKMTRLTQADTPKERNIREIGLEPRQPRPTSEAVRPIQKQQTGLPNIRTYASDMSEEIRKRGETLSTIVSAERSREEKEIGLEPQRIEDEKKQKIKNILLLGGAGLLVTLGIGIVITLFVLMGQSPAELPRESMIPVNKSVTVATEPRITLPVTLAKERTAAVLKLGEIEEIVITENGVPVPPQELLRRFGAPDVLVRNAIEVMVGVHAYNRTQPFIIISVSAYDRAFEGMLLWEATMGDTLGTFFAPINQKAPALKFTDQVFQNVDIRESQSEWRAVYTFPERNLLLITTNNSTVKEVLSRLSLQSGN